MVSPENDEKQSKVEKSQKKSAEREKDLTKNAESVKLKEQGKASSIQSRPTKMARSVANAKNRKELRNGPTEEKRGKSARGK